MNGPRVLFVTHCTSMGGANRCLLQMIKELREFYCIEPLVLAPSYNGPDLNVAAKCREEGVPCITSRFYWFKMKGGLKAYIQMFLNLFLFYPIILYKIRNLDFDLVHTNSSVTDIGAFISKHKGVKHVWHLREYGDLDFGLKPVLGKWYEKYVYSKGDCFLAISKCMKEAFLDVIPEEKIVLSYDGIDASTYNTISNHCSSRVQFVIVGNVCPAKGQLDAVRAMALLKSQGYEACLNIIGPCGGSYADEIKRTVSDKGLSGCVTLYGERDDVPDILAKMDVGLMLSRCEGFGRVTVEYMIQGLAVIASDTGANPEIVVDGVTGLLYPYGDSEALANRMYEIINRRGEIPAMAKKGHERVMGYFLSKRNTAEVYEVYRSILNL